MRQQRVDEFGLRRAAGLGLEHQAHGGVLAGFVTHHVEHRQHRLLELDLIQIQRLLAELDLGIGDFLDFLQHALGADAGRQFLHHQLPLAARQFLYFPARPHLERAASGAVGGGNLGAAGDDLAAARVVGAGNQGIQLFFRQLRIFDQGDAGIGHLAQVVAGDFSRQPDGNAAGAVEQGERQTCRQLARLLGRAVVVRDEIDRAFVDLVHQQRGDARQPGFGVAHGSGTVAVSRAKIALAVDQRVALREVLRHAHQRVIRGLVAVRVKAAQHVAHHAGAFDRPGAGGAVRAAKGQAHARHAVENAPLDRLLAITHIGQRPALDDAQRIFKVGALGIRRQRVFVRHGRRRQFSVWRKKIHGF